MKIAINCCWGGFSLSKEAAEILGCDEHLRYKDDDGHRKEISRSDERLISLIEEKGSEFCSGSSAEIGIAVIPDEATDWRMFEYDGSESVIYVLNGKMWNADYIDPDDDDDEM